LNRQDKSYRSYFQEESTETADSSLIRKFRKAEESSRKKSVYDFPW